MKNIFYFLWMLFFVFSTNAQPILRHSAKADKWVDSVYQSLTPDQRIAQLMVMRESTIKDGKAYIYTDEIKKEIKEYNIGAICLFQGAPGVQATNINQFQQMAQTPLMVCMDVENGVGMRMPEVMKLPDQLTLGAVRKQEKLIKKVGEEIGRQCDRVGVNVAYAPVVDINNNPNNPIIGYRSFGENKRIVADYGVAIMKGIQSNNIMACAKHFPGHGDVDVDSHLALPIIHKSLAQLDTLELYPFKKMFKAGVGSVMIAHLFIPAIDSTPHLASSLSPKFVTDLLRKKMGFQGISFTDALEMKGVSKYFPGGEVAVKSLLAGNDMLCLPENIATSINKINAALKDGRLQWVNLEKSIKKVLYAKFNLGLNHLSNIDTANITVDLNRHVEKLRSEVAKYSLTVVKMQRKHLPSLNRKENIAYVALGADADNTISSQLKAQLGATIFNVPYASGKGVVNGILNKLKAGNFDKIIVGVHNYSKRPADNFDISKDAIVLANKIEEFDPNALLIDFGNPYAIKYFSGYANIIACYEDDGIFQQNAFQFLIGKTKAKGHLPVSVSSKMPVGTGIYTRCR
ncbi:glycoside hydrolase family 3 protein [Arachidicoccus soli]|uniref:beta-N-acetylhexosaminidase n=1 Tax=Arachidicoccus soli TaxID=2341117 RepID=A0A386HSU3_9BACT|nr:glycoside hydrolase family 3 N-terminal domain-containing protein [Arachidicoccus soli]AYD48354.1 glycoside hydrolase family 3 [Arachidicoccus soli]